MTHIWSEEKHGTTRDRRRALDCYPTPPECFDVLAPHISDFPRNVWEPACGDGSLVCAMGRSGYTPIFSDIREGHDFLLAKNALSNGIITNPPYKLAEKFIRHSFSLGIEYLALLLKANFFCAARGGLFHEHPPSHIYALGWRPDFTGEGAPFMDVAWYVWRHQPFAGTQFSVLQRP